MFSCWRGNELAFVKNKKSVLEWPMKYNEYERTQSDLKAETVALTYKRYHKISTSPNLMLSGFMIIQNVCSNTSTCLLLCCLP